MKKIYRIFAVIALICTFLTSNAQVDRLSLTLLPRMPFSNLNNPGIRVNYNGMFGIGLSNFDVSLYNSSLLYDNIYRFENGEPVAIDGVKLINGLQEQGNSLRTDLSLDIVNAGFRVKKLFFNIDWRLRIESQFLYSKDFLGFFVMGNAYYMDDNPADFNFDVSANLFSEIGVTAQYDVNERLTVGIRPKLLIGLANSGIDNEHTKIYTDSETYAMSADVSYRMRGASILNREINTLGDLASLFDFGQLSIGEAMSIGENIGFGIDLGGEYLINKNIGVAAGIYDLGFITWRNTKIKSKEVEGIVVNNAIINNVEELESIDYNKIVSNLVENIWGNDSVFDGEDYNTALKTRVQMQGYYQLNDMLRGTIIAQSYFINGKMYPSVTLAYSGSFAGFFNLTANYTYSTYIGNSVGIGAGLHLGPFNIYAATDNVLVATKLGKATPEMLSAYKAINLRFGIVFSIGKYQDMKTRLGNN